MPPTSTVPAADIDAAKPEPLTAADWDAWISDEVDAARSSYIGRPAWLIGHGRHEEDAARDYAGRELLELLQNAADAAAEAEVPGGVRIEIHPEGLIVANTGAPFTTDGVASLMTANASGKVARCNMIGAKGLGFRSLLNWSREPYISSGPLELGFSHAHALACAQGLGRDSPEIRRLLAGPRALVPLLAFPRTGARSALHERPEARGLIDRARSLRDRFDTVVAAPFDQPEALGRATEQASEFRPEFLLFVPALSEIEILISGRPRTHWRRHDEGKGEHRLVMTGGDAEAASCWTCRRRVGQLAAEEADAPAIHDFELAIALRRDGPAAGRLHSYFPMDTEVPLPALFHATLELDSNRKAPSANSALNVGVLGALAAFYGEILEEEVIAGRGEPMDMLRPSALFPPPLQAFETALYGEAAVRSLIPTLDGRRVPAAGTRLGPKGYEDYLPPAHFGTLARCRGTADRSLLERLGVTAMDPADALRALRAAPLTVAQRAAAILGVVQHLSEHHHDRRLIIDAQERPLERSNTCFPPPASGRPPVLPRWARARFIHPDLWTALDAGLQRQGRARFQALAHFGVNEFNLDGMIASLRRRLSERQRDGRVDGDQDRRDMLATLFGLYVQQGRRSQFPVGRLEVQCADGLWRDARMTHLSEAYGGSGPILSALYAARPSQLVASPGDNGLAGDAETLREFLLWAGVNAWPRGETTSILSGAHRSALVEVLPERFRVWNDSGHDEIVTAQMNWTHDVRTSIQTIADLSSILTGAPWTAILAWLALDRRFEPSWPAAFPTELSARTSGRVHRRYHGHLPDMVRRTIATTPWLPAGTDRKAPRDVMVGGGRLLELFSPPPAPPVAAEYGLTRELWLKGLQVAGAPMQLADLGEQRLYEILEGLEARVASSDLVRKLYAQVLDMEPFDPERGGAVGRRFRGAGRIQVRRGGIVDWADAGQVYYAERDNYPAALREVLALIDLPSRRKASDVLERFGVRVLGQAGAAVRPVNAVECEGIIAALARRVWAEGLPFARACRRAATAESASLRRLDKLQLRVCSKVDLEITLDGHVRHDRLEPWKHLLAEDSLLVVVDPAVDAATLPYLAAEAFADGLAELFGLQSGADFAKLFNAPNDGVRVVQLRRLLTGLGEAEIDLLMTGLEPEVPEFGHGVDAILLAAAEAAAPAAGDHAAAHEPLMGNGGGPGNGERAATSSPPTTAPSPALPVPRPPVIGVEVQILGQTTAAAGNGGGGGGGGGGTRLGGFTGPLGEAADRHGPADAEGWATFFETREGRFPIPVHRLQGAGAFGCDLLSFASEADRETFRADPKRTALVERFIEVKSGQVSLADTQLSAAETVPDRYHVYRIHFDDLARSSARLTVIRNPLGHPAALTRVCTLRIEELAGLPQFRLTSVRAERIDG